MKKFADLPIYFIIIGLILNIIMFLYNRVSFTSLMIRSSVVIILFAAIGYFLAYALSDAHSALSNIPKKSINIEEYEENEDDTASTIDIRIDPEEDELLNLIPQAKDDEFSELTINNFKRFMDQDRE